MLALLVYFIICGCVATKPSTTTTTEHTEDLSQFSRGPELCPGFLDEDPKRAVLISCDDPQCRGISWALPPYRCRQHDGVMFGKEVFGCRCCPRLVACDDMNCASDGGEICHSELLAGCLCVDMGRGSVAPAPPTGAPCDATTAGQMEDAMADLTLDESLNNDGRAITPSSRNCPRDPPVKCLDPQCRGLDDWKTEIETSLTPRCNQVHGRLFIDGAETALHGCPCCPEHINCISPDCNGGTNQACTSAPLHGCFCDWPNPGARSTYWEPAWQPGDPPYIYVNNFDASFDDPAFDHINYPPAGPQGAPDIYDWTDFHGPDVNVYDADAFINDDPDYRSAGGQSLPTTTVSFTATSSIPSEATTVATQWSSIAPTILQNFTWIDLLLRRQESLSLSQNGSAFVMPNHFKDA